MRLIINADDFGMSHEKNVAIDRMMCQEVCTNASLVVNMPWTEEAIRMAKRGNYLDRLSLHINLTIGESITSDIRKVALYYQGGEFVHNAIIKSYFQVLPFHIKVLRQEIEGQMEEFLKYGLKLVSVDSHNWVHLRLPVWLALQPLLNKYHIKLVRPMWIGYKREEIASVRWAKYFRIIEPIILRYKCCRILQHTSNVEQFLLKEHELPKYSIVEVFTHPDLVGEEVIDMSSSYLKKPKQTVIYNIKQIEHYEKITVSQALEDF